MTKPSTVYLVGAGPGDPKLLTRRAEELLRQAQHIVYDALVGPQISALFSPKAQLHYVGKRSGAHSLSQSEINDLLIALAQTQGGAIVRLKGGDPFVFGRGGEEMQALHKANISYEIVPGISSGIAGPAYWGIPVTQRGIASSVTLLTASSRDHRLLDIDWDACARLGGTLVFYMGMRAVPTIAQNLIEHGMEGNTPACILSSATLPEQQILSGTLHTFVSREEDYYESYSPGLFLVGEVISWSKQYRWRAQLPLAGERVIVTRALSQASDLACLLEERGATTSLLPTISIDPVYDKHAIDKAIDALESYAWLFFTSSNAVDIFCSRLLERGLDARALHPCLIAAIGKTTASALQSYGLVADFCPSKATAEVMAQEFVQKYPTSANQRVLYPTSSMSEQTLVPILERAGYRCHYLPIYDTLPLPYTQEELTKILTTTGSKGNKPWVTLCSSSAVHHLLHLVQTLYLEVDLSAIKFAVIGEVTAQALQTYNLKPSIIAQDPSMQSLVRAIEQACQEEHQS